MGNGAASEDLSGNGTGLEPGKDQAPSRPEGLKGWKLSDSRTRPSDLSDHSATKNVIKKMFYLMLAARTGKEMPWGSLTGIRPTKIALTRLEEGWKEEDIRSFMKETYLASDDKIDLSIEIAAREKNFWNHWTMSGATACMWGYHSAPPPVCTVPLPPIPLKMEGAYRSLSGGVV